MDILVPSSVFLDGQVGLVVFGLALGVPVVLDLQLGELRVLVGGHRDETGRREGLHEDPLHALAGIAFFLSGIGKLDHVHAWLVPKVGNLSREKWSSTSVATCQMANFAAKPEGPNTYNLKMWLSQPGHPELN